MTQPNEMSEYEDLSNCMRSGLLGYQPIFFENGIVLGTGLQFFHASDKKLTKTLKNSADLPNHLLGNIYIPPNLKDKIQVPDSDFYLPVAEENKNLFIKYNQLLSDLYKYLVNAVFHELREQSAKVDSVTELGGNTGLFGSMCLEHVEDVTNADIVDYSDALRVIAKYGNYIAPKFHKIESLRSCDVANIPVSDLGWSYAVAVHQSNPMIHICDLSSISRKACLFMTPIGLPGELEQHELLLKFKSTNSYYQTKFPNNFDVTFMSDALIKFSLEKVGFDKIIEIKFPDFIPSLWSEQHKCYLAIRNEHKAPSVYDFSRDAERDGGEITDPEQITLSRQSVHSNIIRYQNYYYIIPHGMMPDDSFFKDSKKWSNLNQALDHLDGLKTPEVVPR